MVQMMLHRRLRSLADHFCRTPLHPQWLLQRITKRELRQLGSLAKGLVLDIGCSDQKFRNYLNCDCNYIGLDYYDTVVRFYQTRPQIFGDAQALPIRNDSIDTIVLTDVLEHLPKPTQALDEVVRALRPGGKILISVPFLYPLHNVPYDFQRWTTYGLGQMVKSLNVKIVEHKHSGQPVETAVALTNIALSKLALDMLTRRNPIGFIVLVLALIAIPVLNLIAWTITALSRKDDLMPFHYLLVLEKVSSANLDIALPDADDAR
jgi:SAM-dependent methyltransferase